MFFKDIRNVTGFVDLCLNVNFCNEIVNLLRNKWGYVFSHWKYVFLYTRQFSNHKCSDWDIHYYKQPNMF